jgi:heat shock protein HslJ
LIDRSIVTIPHLIPETTMLRRLAICWLVVAVFANCPLAATAAETAFPFGRELLLDGKPLRGTKRLPSLSIEQDGSAAIDLWCGSLRGRADVGNGTITITPGERDNAQCAADRVAGDDDLLDMLVHMTNWRRRGDTVELSGPATLRFRLMTN